MAAVKCDISNKLFNTVTASCWMGSKGIDGACVWWIKGKYGWMEKEENSFYELHYTNESKGHPVLLWTRAFCFWPS